MTKWRSETMSFKSETDKQSNILQGSPEKTARSLLHRNIATMRHIVTRYSPKCSEINKQALLCTIELGSIKCNIETAKNGILLALKSVIYFRFGSETIGVEPIVLMCHTKKNYLIEGEEMHIRYR